MIDKITTFNIVNDTGKNMIIVHEPEYWEFTLPPLKEIEIEIDSIKQSVSLSHSFQEGQVVIRVMDYNGNYKVMCEGKDVFEEYYDLD